MTKKGEAIRSIIASIHTKKQDAPQKDEKMQWKCREQMI